MKTRRAGTAGVAALAALTAGAGRGVETNPPPPAAVGEIVVTASRTQNPAADVAASVEVIDRRRLEATGAKSVDEAFRHLAGIDLQGSGVPGAMVRLNARGLTPGYQSERILTLVDGRRINDPYQGNVEFAQLPADNVERIELLRGPASALYGSNAEGGVINIVTRRGRPEPATELKAAAGDFGTQLYRVSHGWKSGALDYFATAGYTASEGYLDTADGRDQDWAAQNYTANAGWDFGDGAELRAYGGDYEGRGTDANSERESHKDYAQAEYRRWWDSPREPQLLLRAYRNGERQIYDWTYPGRGLYRQQTLAAEAQHSLWLRDGQRLTSGAEAREESVDISEVTGPIDEATAVYAAYVQDELALGAAWRLTVGLRHDYDADYGGEWSPRAGLLWRALPAAEVYAGYNRAHRAPGLSDRFVNVEYNGFRFLGNPDLQPETLDAFELGLRARPAEGWELNAAAFWNELREAFDFMLDADGVFRNRNATRIRAAGAEAETRYRLGAAWWTFANYTFTDGSYEEFEANPAVEGNRLAYLARHKAAAGIEYRPASGWLAALSARYNGSRYGDAQNTAERKLGDYATADAHGRAPLAKGATLTLDVQNLFDRRYQELPGLDQCGRFVMAGVEWAF